MKPNDIDIGTLIVRSADIREGQPRIAGTDVSVQRIAGWYKLGLAPEEIADQLGHLNLAQVYAALTYYHANQDEIEAALAAEMELIREIEERREEIAQNAWEAILAFQSGELKAETSDELINRLHISLEPIDDEV